jgi:hypothetical protein
MDVPDAWQGLSVEVGDIMALLQSVFSEGMWFEATAVVIEGGWKISNGAVTLVTVLDTDIDAGMSAAGALILVARVWLLDAAS